PRISDDMRRRIVRWRIEFGLSIEEVATLAGCKPRAVKYILSNFYHFQDVRNPFKRQPGRPRNLTSADINYITAVIDANPKIYLDELQARLLRDRN
ncbi:hypothetical protein BKA70DRAFT_1047877, partial [Coprinopsis sp. MPI-PUGE-AT-0042]